MSEENISFSKAIDELEEILLRIESGDMDLDDLTSQVKRASSLLKICNNKLKLN